MTDSLELSSGIRVDEPMVRLIRFCRAEYAYYDGVPKGHVNHVEPVDVLATVGINSRVDTAVKVREVHLGVSAACDPLLAAIPATADLLLDTGGVTTAAELLSAAMTSKYVLLAVAAKVMHRKRPALIPVLDAVVVGHYLGRLGERELLARSWSQRKAAEQVALIALSEFKSDLQRAHEPIEALKEQLANEGFELSALRILDVLIWTEVEPTGHYRDSGRVSL